MERCIGLDASIPYSEGQFLWTGFDDIGESTRIIPRILVLDSWIEQDFPRILITYIRRHGQALQRSQFHVFPYWDFNEGQMIDIRVCSNCCAAELFVSGAGEAVSVNETTAAFAELSATQSRNEERPVRKVELTG